MQIDNIPYQIELEFEYPLFHLTGSANLGNLLTSGLFMWDIQLTGGGGRALMFRGHYVADAYRLWQVAGIRCRQHPGCQSPGPIPPSPSHALIAAAAS